MTEEAWRQITNYILYFSVFIAQVPKYPHLLAAFFVYSCLVGSIPLGILLVKKIGALDQPLNIPVKEPITIKGIFRSIALGVLIVILLLAFIVLFYVFCRYCDIPLPEEVFRLRQLLFQ